MRLNPIRNCLAIAAAAFVGLSLWCANAADYPTTLSGYKPVGYWKLNETTPVPVGDIATNLGSVGWIGNGDYVEGVIHAVTGIPGDGGGATAINLTNVNVITGQAKLRIPWRPQWNTNGAFSVEFWARPDYPSLLGCPASSVDRMLTPNQGWLFYQGDTGASTGNGWYFRVINTSGGSINAAVNDYLDNTKWYHIVGVFDGAHVMLYTNGVLAASVAMTGAYQPVTMGGIPLVFGGRADGRGGNLGWGGDMTEAAVYNTALSSDRVAAHYSAGITAGNGYAVAVSVDNPVGWWRMNEPAYTAPDPSTLPISANSGTLGAAAQGTNFPGVLSGQAGPPCLGMGANNYSCLIDGGMGLINCGADPGLNVPSNCTITAWVKIRGWSRFNEALFGKGSFGYQLARSGSTGPVNTMLYGAGGAVIPAGPAVQSSRAVFDGYWHHVAGVYDGSAMSLYIDGTLEVSGAYTGGMTPTTDPFTIGEVWYNGAPIWIQGGGSGAGYMRTLYDGWIAHVAVLTNALTAPQVQQLFDAAQELPILTLQPQPPVGNIYEGMSVSFSSAAIGASTLNYQWTKNGSPLSGKTASTLSLLGLTTGANGNYAVVINNSYGAVTSSIVTLTVQTSPPIIFSQPKSITRFADGSATFTVVMGGSTPLSYQWSNDGGPIAGATKSSYTINNLRKTDAGSYSVQIANFYGVTNSTTATLTVLSTAPYSAVVMAGKPAIYWRLNSTNGNTANDFANGYDGTNNGTMTLSAGLASPAFPGFESGNQSYTFNGNLTFMRGPALDLNRNAMAVSVWVVANNLSSGYYNGIVTKGDTSWRLHQQLTASGVQWGANGPSAGPCNAPMISDDGQWHHLVGVYTGSGSQLYVDGALASSTSGTGLIATNRFWIEVGENAEQTGRYWNGKICEVSLYNRPLSGIEVSNLYLTATLGPTPPVIVQEPSAQSVLVGESVSFSATVFGGGPWSYVWKKNGVDMPGETNRTFDIRSAYYTDAAAYSVGITNTAGGVLSTSAALTVVPLPRYANLTNGMVAHLKFDGSFVDATSYHNDGTAQGAPSNIAPGKIGSGGMHYSTDSASSTFNYVSIANSSSLQFGAGQDFSVAFWTRFTGTPGNLPFLANSYNSYGDPGVTFAPASGRGGWSWYINDAYALPGQGLGAVDQVGGTINDGQWHNLAFTFNRAGFATVYLDGDMVSQVSIVGAHDWNLDTGNAWNIGQASGGYTIDGAFDIDDLGVWRRELTQAEAESIYLVGQNYGKTFDTYGPVGLTVGTSGNNLDVSWQAGTLLQSTNVQGTFTPVPAATAPFYRTTPSNSKMFYRVQQ